MRDTGPPGAAEKVPSVRRGRVKNLSSNPGGVKSRGVGDELPNIGKEDGPLFRNGIKPLASLMLLPLAPQLHLQVHPKFTPIPT